MVIIVVMEQAVKDYILGALKASDVPRVAKSLGISNDDIYEVITDYALERIYEGDSFREIATTLGMTHGRISQILDRNEDAINRSARAMAASAEAWLDKGLAVVEDAIDNPSYQGDGKDSGASRAYAQECARRAAIRNPRYREKTGVELSGPGGAPIKTINASVSPEAAAMLYKELLG